MKLTDSLPRPFAWIARIVMYGIAGVIVLAQCSTIGKFRQFDAALQCADDPAMQGAQAKTALLRTQALMNCLERKNNFVENLWQWRLRSTLRGLPNTPPSFVGDWVSSQPGCTYCLHLRADGGFSGEPIACKISSESFSGSWGVHKDRMVWMYDDGKVWPPDVNPIEDRAPDRFVLVEKDGSRTQFRRADAGSTSCGRRPEPVRAVVPAAAVPEAVAGAPAEPSAAPDGQAAPAVDYRVPVVAPASDPADRARRDAAREVATMESAVDATLKLCRQVAPQQAATVQLARERWRRQHADLLARTNAFVRDIFSEEDATRLVKEARLAGELQIAQIARAPADTVRTWCGDAALSFESGRFNLRANPETVAALLGRPDGAGRVGRE